jgi:hypothetical protein
VVIISFVESEISVAFLFFTYLSNFDIIGPSVLSTDRKDSHLLLKALVDIQYYSNMELNENQQDTVVSALASHFGTNYTPTNDELLEIHNLLVEPSARTSELEVEMARIVAKHAKLKRLVANYRALASPMRRLPVDLLREVFHHCLPTEHNAILSHKEAPAVPLQ